MKKRKLRPKLESAVTVGVSVAIANTCGPIRIPARSSSTTLGTLRLVASERSGATVATAAISATVASVVGSMAAGTVTCSGIVGTLQHRAILSS